MRRVKNLHPARIAQRVHREARRLLPRRLHLYGVGLGRTGTTTLARMFRPRFRSVHEAEADRLVPVSAARVRDEVDPDTVDSALRRRSLRLGLEVDVANFLWPFAAELAALHPNARFVLTIRNCFGWLDSMYEHILRYPMHGTNGTRPVWLQWRETTLPCLSERYGAEEGSLARAGLPPIGVALAYWARGNTSVIDAVPEHRLLVVRTDDLDVSARRIAEFCGIRGSLAKPSHANASPFRRGILRSIPTDYLVEVAEGPCATLMAQHWGPAWRELAHEVGQSTVTNLMADS